MALSFEGTLSLPHFDRTAFKVIGKKIFATLHEPSGTANLVLTPAMQKVFCEMSEGIYPVANKWGGKGWTTFELQNVERGIILEGLASAWEGVK
ncbi:MAG: MmcQ/YjbR family DNA-binding protein [Ginsengibacter sp.]